MARRRGVWLLSLTLAAVGWLTAHSLAYVFVAPEAEHRSDLHAEAGHGYLGAAPVLVACALTLLLAGVAMAIHEGVRGAPRAQVGIWPLALVPPLGFAVQEHLERLIELNAFPFGAALEPTFLVGMALQLPFAIAALALARRLLVLGHAAGARIAARRSWLPRAGAVAQWVRAWPGPQPPRRSILSTGHGERAPPRVRLT
jgi:hypothetical protein